MLRFEFTFACEVYETYLRACAVTNGEKGKSTLESMVAILIAFEMTEQLNSFIPKQEISPVQLIELQGKERKRATSSSKNSAQTKDTAKW